MLSTVELGTPPDEDDSLDLTDGEIDAAIPTHNVQELAEAITRHLRERPGWFVEKHELRRRKPHLYWRNSLKSPTGDSLVLTLRVDWLNMKE